MLWRPWSTRILEKKKMGMQSWLERQGRRAKWKWWNHVKSCIGSDMILWDIVWYCGLWLNWCRYSHFCFKIRGLCVATNGERPRDPWQGKVNDDGIRLLRRLCVEVRSRHPGVLLSAEESTNFKWVSNQEPVAWYGSKTVNQFWEELWKIYNLYIICMNPQKHFASCSQGYGKILYKTLRWFNMIQHMFPKLQTWELHGTPSAKPLERKLSSSGYGPPGWEWHWASKSGLELSKFVKGFHCLTWYMT